MMQTRTGPDARSIATDSISWDSTGQTWKDNSLTTGKFSYNEKGVVGDHRLVFLGVGMGDGFKCSVCEEEFKIPEIVSKSNGFLRAVYEVYLFGQMIESSCDGIPTVEEIGDGVLGGFGTVPDPQDISGGGTWTTPSNSRYMVKTSDGGAVDIHSMAPTGGDQYRVIYEDSGVLEESTATIEDGAINLQ